SWRAAERYDLLGRGLLGRSDAPGIRSGRPVRQIAGCFRIQRRGCLDFHLLESIELPPAPGGRGPRPQPDIQGSVLSLRDSLRHLGAGRLPVVDGVVGPAARPSLHRHTVPDRANGLVRTAAARDRREATVRRAGMISPPRPMSGPVIVPGELLRVAAL